MDHKAFINELDHPAITAAIARAERQSTGQIRVFVSRRKVDDALPAAAKRFARLGMQKTAGRNAVLIYFAPVARRYAIVGDTAIHERCGGEAFWRALVGETMAPLLRQGHFTAAIVSAVEAVGEQLAAHFPRAGAETANELPDDVETD